MWLNKLASEIGFTGSDIDKYRHRKHAFTLACRGGCAIKPVNIPAAAQLQHPADDSVHDDAHGMRESKSTVSMPAVGIQRSATVTSQADGIHSEKSRHSRTGDRVVARKHNLPWLLPVVSCTVVEEGKAKSSKTRLQMFTQGYPHFVLPECSEYWDGSDIWSMEPSRRENILEFSRQWQQEGMVVHAFAYNPISVKETDLFDMLDEMLGNYDAQVSRLAEQQARSDSVALIRQPTRPVLTLPSPAKPLVGLSVDKSSIFLLAQLLNKRSSVGVAKLCTEMCALSRYLLSVCACVVVAVCRRQHQRHMVALRWRQCRCSTPPLVSAL